MQNLNLQQIPVSSQPLQEMTFNFNGRTLRITLRFNSVCECWSVDLFDMTKQKQISQGLGLVCGVPLLWRTSQPYFLWLEDESNQNLDPMSLSDMGNRCTLYIGEKP